MLHFHRDLFFLEIIFYCPLSGLKGIHLALRISCRRILMDSPVIDNSRNMINMFLSCFLAQTKNKLEILSSIVGSIQLSHLVNQCLFDQKEMTDIIVTAKKIVIKIRFKMRIKELRTIGIHLILVRVDHKSIRVLVIKLDILIESIRCQGIIMIIESDKITGSKIHRLVHIPCDSIVFCQSGKTDFFIVSVMLFYIIFHLVIGTSIGNTKLPVTVGLSLYRLDHLF